MLSKEEKEAIEFLQEFRPKMFWKEPIKVGNQYAMKDDINLKNKIETVLNLITKLQKENEEKDKQIDLMGEVIFKRFTAQLVIEYGIENKEQFIKKFERFIKEKGK